MPVSYQGLLSGLLALTEQTYAPHPVWSNSTTKPVQFTPLPKKVAMRLWRYAREFDRQTKEKGRHGGAVGHTGLQVLHSLIFDFLNHRTGRLDPSYAAIATKAGVCVRTVATALKRLRELGILNWVRRCAAAPSVGPTGGLCSSRRPTLMACCRRASGQLDPRQRHLELVAASPGLRRTRLAARIGLAIGRHALPSRPKSA